MDGNLASQLFGYTGAQTPDPLGHVVTTGPESMNRIGFRKSPLERSVRDLKGSTGIGALIIRLRFFFTGLSRVLQSISCGMVSGLRGLQRFQGKCAAIVRTGVSPGRFRL